VLWQGPANTVGNINEFDGHFPQICDLEVGTPRLDPNSSSAMKGDRLPEHTSLLFRAASGGG